jgi:hypothetical protein
MQQYTLKRIQPVSNKFQIIEPHIKLGILCNGGFAEAQDSYDPVTTIRPLNANFANSQFSMDEFIISSFACTHFGQLNFLGNLALDRRIFVEQMNYTLFDVGVLDNAAREQFLQDGSYGEYGANSLRTDLTGVAFFHSLLYLTLTPEKHSR